MAYTNGHANGHDYAMTTSNHDTHYTNGHNGHASNGRHAAPFEPDIHSEQETTQELPSEYRQHGYQQQHQQQRASQLEGAPSGSFEQPDDWEATQEVLSQAVPKRTQPFVPLGTPPEEHWATLIPDTSNSTCPRIELLGTQEKKMHVIGRRENFRNNKGVRVDTDTVINSPNISGTHCSIWREWDPEAPGDPDMAVVYLQDYSTNGTYVNTVKCHKSKIALGDGDDISLGPRQEGSQSLSDRNTEFRFRFQLEYLKSNRSQRRKPEDAGGLFLKYDVRGQIGSGSFATVHRAIDKRNGQWCAVKIIDKKRFKHNPKTVLMLQREIEIMKALNNPYIVRWHEGFEDPEYLWLVMEYVNGGDLLDFVLKKKGLEEHEAADVAFQVCTAIAYLHQQGIAHRDLKPENILMTREENPRCKVADFGLAKWPGSATFLKTMCGTPTYLAPEVILQGPDTPGYSFAVDAWSVGVIVYSCMANASPFLEDEEESLVMKMKKRYPDLDTLFEIGCSEAAVDFCGRLMIFNPAQRMTVYDATRHPWLKEVRARREGSSNRSSLMPYDPNVVAHEAGSQREPRAGRGINGTARPAGATPPVASAPLANGYAAHQALQDSGSASSVAEPLSRYSSMLSMTRSRTESQEEISDVISEAPSYSQRMQKLRIESDFDLLDGSSVIQDSQEEPQSNSKAEILLDGEDCTPPAAHALARDDSIASQAVPPQSLKRKQPTSAFSSDESMQSSGPVRMQESSLFGFAPSPHGTNGIEQPVPVAAEHGDTNASINATEQPAQNKVVIADYAMRDRPPSPASSDSSLSPLEESPPKKTPSNALKSKSTNSNSSRGSSRTPRQTKTPPDGPVRRSARLSASHTTSSATPPASANGRSRKHPRLSSHPL